MDGPIPAGAGEPSSRSRVSGSWRAYPRGCGGTRPSWRLPTPPPGLSPRVRGNPQAPRAGRGVEGPIPAGAGEPARDVRTWWRGRAYPRGCGGTVVSLGLSFTAQGLSPRVRGNHAGIVVDPVTGGPIPAGAGEPLPTSRRGSRPRAYPRGCGGTDAVPVSLDDTLGLSPRVRGNREGSNPSTLASGPIPAGAGEPAWRARRGRIGRAYPRGCGGTRMRHQRRCRCGGLSPRVRGNHGAAALPLPVSGPIPAGAGEPPAARHWTTYHGAYPRGCGGTYSTSAPAGSELGLSPRVRGNLCHATGCFFSQYQRPSVKPRRFPPPR